MKATATDMRLAWHRAKEFLEDQNEVVLFLQLGMEHSKQGYTIIKLPYGENIDLLYALSWYDSCLIPLIDLKYAGFYNRITKQSYNIREPLTRFFEFDGKQIYEGELQKMVADAIQSTVAGYVAGIAKEHSVLYSKELEVELRSDAEQAFSKKETQLDFSKKVKVNMYHISELAIVDYIDNPANIQNSGSHLKHYVDDKIIGHEEELVRLWYAHCTSQRLLDQLYAESKGNNRKK